MKKIMTVFVAALLLVGCDDLFTPAIENNKQVSDGLNDPLYAEGILANAYTRNPYNSQSFNDVATDDAVTNQTSNSYLKMATVRGQPTVTRWINGVLVRLLFTTLIFS